MTGISRREALRILGVCAGPAFAAGTCRAGARAEAAAECPVTGRAEPELTPFDDLMRTCVKVKRAPGVGIAVTCRGRLVYARGFGFADRERRKPVQPETLFRIASVSKPFTAVAILQLVEQKKLDLDDRVHAVLQLGPPSDPRWKEVTVRHLLRHTGGWDREKSFDPMFRPLVIATDLRVPPPARPEHIIRYMLKQPLDFDPGSRYAYSNFGFCLLGRVIERVVGLPYEKFVQQHVLWPLGISRMRIGRSLAGQRVAGEAVCYDSKKRVRPAVVGELGEPVPLPYGGFYLEALDAHGGWIASAVDLVRFAAAFDSATTCKILRPESIATMFSRPEGASGWDAAGRPKRNYYACGWEVWNFGRRGMNAWHEGSLPGTSTLLVRRRDGLCWAVLFNCDADADGKALASSIDAPLHQAADAVKRWPDIDLFQQYGQGTTHL